MSAYIGNAPGLTLGSVFVFFPAAGATVLSGIDSQGLTLSYTRGAPYLRVLVNGLELAPSDYTATDGSSITLAGGKSFSSGDVVVVRADNPFNPADTYTVAALDAKFAGLPFALRNRLINGDLRIAQRATSATLINSAYQVCDRWYGYASGLTGGSVSRIATTAYGGQYCQNIGGTAITAGGYMDHRQRIESENIADLVGKTVTLSFWCGASVTTGGYSGQLWLGIPGSLDNYAAPTYDGPYTFSLDGTPKRVSISFVVPAGAVNGLEVFLRFLKDGTAGTNPGFNIGTVQLEEGATATAFERRPIGLELALCQRYYQTVPAWMGAMTTVANVAAFSGSLPVPMRVAPSVSIGPGSGTSFCTAFNIATYNAVSIYASNVNVRGGWIGVTMNTGPAANTPLYTYGINWCQLTAEL